MLGWEIGGCVFVVVELEVVVDIGLGCVFGGVDLIIEWFFLIKVLYLFDVVIVYIYLFEFVIIVDCCSVGFWWFVFCSCEMSDCLDIYIWFLILLSCC